MSEYFKNSLYLVLLTSKKRADRLTVINICDGNGHCEKRVKSIPEGNLYLDTQIKDFGVDGFSEVREIEAVIAELREDATTIYLTDSFQEKSQSYAISRQIDARNQKTTVLRSNEAFVIDHGKLDKRSRRLWLIIMKTKRGELAKGANKLLAVEAVNRLRSEFELKPVKKRID
jgi:hypothetical protein